MSDSSPDDDDPTGSDDGSENASDGGSGTDSDCGDSSGDGDSDDGEVSDDSGSGSDKGKNWLEWTITVLGGVLVVFVIGFLAYEWISATGAPADLEVSLGEAVVDSVFVEIPVTVENKGGRVAEGAVIEVCAGPDACSEVTFAYVPFESTVTGRVGFRAPLAAEPTTRVVSYRNP